MSGYLVVVKTPITFEEYILEQQIALEKYCSPFFEKFEMALKNGQTFCEFSFSLNHELRFPWSLVAHELANRFPEHKTRVISRMYDPGPEIELHIDSYTIRFKSNKDS